MNWNLPVTNELRFQRSYYGLMGGVLCTPTHGVIHPLHCQKFIKFAYRKKCLEIHMYLPHMAWERRLIMSGITHSTMKTYQGVVIFCRPSTAYLSVPAIGWPSATVGTQVHARSISGVFIQIKVKIIPGFYFLILNDVLIIFFFISGFKCTKRNIQNHNRWL